MKLPKTNKILSTHKLIILMNLRPISASIILCSIQSTTTNVGLWNKRIWITLCEGIILGVMSDRIVSIENAKSNRSYDMYSERENSNEIHINAIRFIPAIAHIIWLLYWIWTPSIMILYNTYHSPTVGWYSCESLAGSICRTHKAQKIRNRTNVEYNEIDA